MDRPFLVGGTGSAVAGVDTVEAERERLPQDAAERKRALEVQRSWIVEAPAGSGKTGLLIQRYLKLLAEESVTVPGQVLAITFTKKAVAEIRERVAVQLEGAALGRAVKDTRFDRETRALAEAVLEKDRRLGWGLLESPQRMGVKTIDSLCTLIAGAMPVLSGGGAGMAPAEDAWPLYAAAARRTVMQFGGHDTALDEALRVLLLHRDGNLQECERLLGEMLALREQWGELIPLSGVELDEEYLEGTVLPKLERALAQMVCAGLTRLAESVPADFLAELAGLASSLAGIEPHGRAVSPVKICAGKGAPGTDADHLEHWRALIHLLVARSTWTWRKALGKNVLGFELNAGERAHLRRLLQEIEQREDLLGPMREVDRLPPAKYPREQWEVAKALFRLLSCALVELQLVFAERGECDFAELGLLARSALRHAGGLEDLATAWGFELRHMLVDEMQDTSTGQYELIELLTQGWDGRSQTVFLVGDPKQSIYLFRQARVERFVRTMREQRLGELPVDCLRLTANFRSQQDLVDDFNEDFSVLFAGGRGEAEVPYVQAEAVRGFGDAGGMRWHTRVIEGRSRTLEAGRERRRWQKEEALTVRSIAKAWLRRPLPEGRAEPWKIAVLVQARRHLVDVVAALKEDDGEGAIPFSAVKIDLLDQRQEVMDLFALTRALLHPADRVAWLAVLRAPWCGLSLADLHTVAGGDDLEAVERCLPDQIAALMAATGELVRGGALSKDGVPSGELVSEDGRPRLERLWRVMLAAETQRGRMRIAEWVERTWRSLGGDVSLTEAEFGNARRYLQLVEEVEAGAAGFDKAMLKRRMGKLYAQAAGGEGAVELMTIHGAKGLEWDVVMVPGLARRAGSSQAGLLVWNEIEEAGSETAHGMLAPIAGRGEESKELNQWMKGLRAGREAAEQKRLFYVACTRAREELHLFAAPDRSSKGEILREPNSLLKAAWPAAERHFAEAAAEQASGVLPFIAAPEDGEERGGLAIAAGGEGEPMTVSKPAMLQRLPLSFDVGAGFRVPDVLGVEAEEERSRKTAFSRPEGSLAARAFGNAVHAFLELASKRIGAGVAADALLREASGWRARVEVVLRGAGLPPAMVRREAQRVVAAIDGTLRDAEGRWVLGQREGAASEYAFTTWGERRSSFRLDRMFVAGKEPLAGGSDCLWIVDYKTSAHGRGVGLEDFLTGELDKYGAQMESYARAIALAGERKDLRVGLYYTMLPKLLWWKPDIS